MSISPRKRRRSKGLRNSRMHFLGSGPFRFRAHFMWMAIMRSMWSFLPSAGVFTNNWSEMLQPWPVSNGSTASVRISPFLEGRGLKPERKKSETIYRLAFQRGSAVAKGYSENSASAISSVGISASYQIFSPAAACSSIMPMPGTVTQPKALASRIRRVSRGK